MRAHPTAERFLAGSLGSPRHGSREAADRLACDLRFAIEVDGPELLTGDAAALLDAARQLEPERPVARVLGLPDLVRLLTRFVGDPAYRPSDPLEARIRLEQCDALLHSLAAQPALEGRAGLLRRADEAIRIEWHRLGRRSAQR